MMKQAKRFIEALSLQPHPEGGYYREVFRSTRTVASARGERRTATAIYYLLSEGDVSRWHTVRSDEIWNFYSGDPLELFVYDPAAQHLDRHVLTNEIPLNAIGIVASGRWQAARPLGAYALIGCVVAPGFEFIDFQLVRDIPGHERHFSGALASLATLL